MVSYQIPQLCRIEIYKMKVSIEKQLQKAIFGCLPESSVTTELNCGQPCKFVIMY